MHDLSDFNIVFLLVGAGILAFVITLITIPTIIRMSRFKKLFDIIDERKIHSEQIPRLGGMGIFAGLSISILLFVQAENFLGFGGLLAGLIILFFVGLKDDILIISPLTKFLGQIVAASIVIFFGGVMITDLHGFFGINQLHPIVGFGLTIIVFLATTNAFNFIDGVDGLSASLGITSALAFGIWFFLIEQYQHAIVCVALIASLAGFVRFNLFSKKNKIFMGDTGAMIIGYMLSFLAIKFNELDLSLNNNDPFFILPAPAVAFSVMIVPYFDMLRVIYIRLLKKKSIFFADKNHLHHLLLELGLSHKQITFALTFITMIFIGLVYWLSDFVTIRRLLLVVLILALLLSFIPEILVKRKRLKNRQL
ncbi:MAG: undecaprenyl/decaprenyl-phosphate alpha-N-acetylglucosaminyl 1-phosphate transferase [Bacteroidales bacterium]|nr:undecaprenyl/decaprenyl-phosphate alpha-N-acetylglucosaminyl 1-phosphate transferase [Bacteroidales bacterium]